MEQSNWPPRDLPDMSEGEVLAISTTFWFRMRPQDRTFEAAFGYAEAYLGDFNPSALTEAKVLCETTHSGEDAEVREASRWAGESIRHALRKYRPDELDLALTYEAFSTIAENKRFDGPDHREPAK